MPSPERLKTVGSRRTKCAERMVLMTFVFLDVGMQSMCGGDKALESLVYRLTLQQAIQHGDCYVARNGDTICGVAAWLAPGFDWTIQ